DTCDLFRGERAVDSGRESQHQTAGWDHRALRYQGSGADDGVLTDNDVIEESRPHPDQAVGFDRAAVHHHSVPNGHIILENQRARILHDMPDRAVLNIRVLANADVVDIAPDDTVVPDARMVADFHVADNLSAVGDINPRAQFWRFSLILMQHP